MKKNTIITLFIGITIGAIISGISVYAATVGSNLITYSRTGSEVENVEGALNELYTKALVGDALAGEILSGKTALVGGLTVTGSMANTGAVTLTAAQKGTTTINGYVTTINAANVYNAGYNAKTCPSTSCSCQCGCAFDGGGSFYLIKNGSVCFNSNVGNGWTEKSC